MVLYNYIYSSALEQIVGSQACLVCYFDSTYVLWLFDWFLPGLRLHHGNGDDHVSNDLQHLGQGGAHRKWTQNC